MKKKLHSFLNAVKLKNAAIALTLSISALSFPASAEWQHIGYLGDLNGDNNITVSDLVIMKKHLSGEQQLTSENLYYVNNTLIGIDGSDGIQVGEYLDTADINQDGVVNCFDLILLKRSIILNDPKRRALSAPN